MKAKKNALEWTVFAVSAVIFTVLIGYLVVQALRGSSSEPRIEVTTGAAHQRGQLWALPVTIRNDGDHTAEEVRVEVAVQRDGKDVEVAELTVAFLPRRSQREAWALFRADPRSGNVTARAVAFKLP